MYAQAEKPKENSFPTNKQESRAVANSVAQKKSNAKQAFGFVNNRPNAVVQRKLQEMEKNNPKLKELRTFQEKDDNRKQAKKPVQLQFTAENHFTQKLYPIQKAGKQTCLINSKISSLEPIQLYTDAGGEKRTENDKYVVYHSDDDDQSKLYISQGAAPPLPANLIVATGQNKNIAGFNYAEYHYDPTRNFTNDCLTLAENLIRGVDQDSDRAELRATGDRPNGTDRLFGHTDKQNLSIATGTWNTGEATNPNIGEAYGITRTRQPNVGETPYHIAAVVAKDGVDNVTLEADAGNEGQDAPVFDIYDTTPAATRINPISLTFEETYAQTYGPSATGILRQR
jgi:hypothetical protein